jgi:saccharopine dehydrogenase (NAD+, L-lysine-forming)
LKDSPYLINQSIGYDINFNKFKNHGIEIRFFEWFPEEYMVDVANFFILLAQHSITTGSFSYDKSKYDTIIHGCVRRGFTYELSILECQQVLSDLSLPLHGLKPMTAYELLTHMSHLLFERYHDGEIVRLMSPNMKQPVFVNYNYIAYRKLHHDLFGKPTLIIRAEINPLETRTPIVPSDLASLLSNFTVLVESSSTRCYSDEDYCKQGARIVPAGYWVQSRYSYVVGLKEINATAHPTQTLLHFAHCFKGQPGWEHTMSQIQPCTFIDYEYMLDANKKRVISFCGQSGKIGAYLALMAFHNSSNKEDLPPFDEDTYRIILEKMDQKPTVLLIGYGVVGQAAKAVLDQFDISCTICTSKDTITKDMIFNHQILIHAIRLSDDVTVSLPPFLTKEDLASHGSLSVICDISCDLGNPRNMLPIYDEYTTKLKPVAHLQPNLDLIAISNLPSLEPDVSSDRFSSTLIHYMPYLIDFQMIYGRIPEAAVLFSSYHKFYSFQVKEK